MSFSIYDHQAKDRGLEITFRMEKSITEYYCKITLSKKPTCLLDERITVFEINSELCPFFDSVFFHSIHSHTHMDNVMK